MSGRLRNCIVMFSAVIVFVAVFLLCRNIKEATPENKPANEGVVANISLAPKPADTSDWTDYTNERLGFSIKIPPKVFMIGCRKEDPTFSSPRILEDGNSVYVLEDYYRVDSEGQCVKISYSLDDIKEQIKESSVYPSPHLGWNIIINDVDNDQDILSMLRQSFGSGCLIDSRFLQDDGNYRIFLKGERNSETDPWWGSCPLNFSYRVIYSPEKKKMMSVTLGQECKFQSTNPELSDQSYRCYDEEMAKSFKFD